MPSSWVPLESNPDVINKYMRKLGIGQTLECVDLLGFDAESLSLVPGHPRALLFLYPTKDDVSQISAEAVLKQPNDDSAKHVYFMKQTVGNACGTVALIHALANLHESIDLGAGSFAKFYEKTKSASPDERAKILESDEDMRLAHEACAGEGDTLPPSSETNVDYHYVALVNVKNHLYELDGRREGPVSYGMVKESEFFKRAADLCEKRAKQQPDTIHFTALVLTTVE